jgi:hypothetical protein
MANLKISFLIILAILIFAGVGTAEALSNVTGTIKNKHGEAVPYTILYVKGQNGYSNRIWADSNGQFTLTGLEDSQYRITPRLLGYSFKPSFVTVSGSDVNIVLTSSRSRWDGALNWSIKDSTPPGIPQNLTVEAISKSSITLNWDVPPDNISPSGFFIYNGSDALIWAGERSYHREIELSEGTQYCYKVSAFDGSGNISAKSGQACTTTPSNFVWTHPGSLANNISPTTLYAYDSPSIAMGNNEEAVLVWRQSQEFYVDSYVFKSEYEGGEWTHPGSLANNISPVDDAAYAAEVAMDDSGNAIIVWEVYNGTKTRIYTSEKRGGLWSHPGSVTNSISPDIGPGAFVPKVAMDNNGNSIITWQQNDGTKNRIFKSEYRDSSWTHPVTYNDSINPLDITSNAYIPDVAMADNGDAIIIWTQTSLFKSEYRSGAWTHPSTEYDYISPDDGQMFVQDNDVAMDENGNTIIVWQQNNGSYNRVYMSEYRGGTWTHPGSLANSISPAGPGANSPKVAMDNNGNAIITWRQSDGTKNQIFKSEYRSGSWTHPASLTDNISPDGQNSDSPDIAMNDNGNAIITWQQFDGSDVQIFKSEYRNSSWTHPASLAESISPGGWSASVPVVAMDDNDNTIITWVQYNGSSYQIYFSEYRNQ